MPSGYGLAVGAAVDGEAFVGALVAAANEEAPDVLAAVGVGVRLAHPVSSTQISTVANVFIAERRRCSCRPSCARVRRHDALIVSAPVRTAPGRPVGKVSSLWSTGRLVFKSDGTRSAPVSARSSNRPRRLRGGLPASSRQSPDVVVALKRPRAD